MCYPQARRFRLPTMPHCVRTKQEPTSHGCWMTEGSKFRTRLRRLPCERFRPNEPKRVLPGAFGALDRSLALWWKIPFFSCYFPCSAPVIFGEKSRFHGVFCRLQICPPLLQGFTGTILLLAAVACTRSH